MIFNRLFFVQKNDLRPPLALALLGPCSPIESLNYGE